MKNNRLYLRLVNTALELSGFDPQKIDGYLIAQKLSKESGGAESFIDSLTYERLCREVAEQFRDNIPEADGPDDTSVVNCICQSCTNARRNVAAMRRHPAGKGL